MVIELKEQGKEPERKMNKNGRMLCPVCQVPLSMADRQGVEIDFCPDCRGVWLDRGELDKIIERSTAEMAPPPRQRDHDDDGGYRHGKHGGYGKYGSRRKSWLMEIFD
tara:strand:+ start:290 stop:613 length:324 start_codon:yes stop_codon:yes gene_type:complete